MTHERLAERVEQWDRADRQLRADRLRRLRSMTDDEARQAAEDLLALVDEAPPKRGLSGLVEQQRIFALVTE